MDEKRPAGGERCSLHSLQPSPWRGWCCLIFALANCGVVLFSHIALALVIETNLPREALDAANLCLRAETPARLLSEHLADSDVASDACSGADIEIWHTIGNRTLEIEAVCGLGCGTASITGTACYAECMQEEGYSLSCATCFGQKGQCAARNCFRPCLPPNELGLECTACGAENCGYENSGAFGECHGMGPWRSSQPTSATTSVSPGTGVTEASRLDKYETVNDVGELAFWDGVRESWNGDAYALAILVFVASGINPYLENILLMVALFAPLTSRHRKRLLWFVNRFGRWTFVDVFCVVIIVRAVNFRAMSDELHVRSLTRPGIYAFGFATIWARIQGALIEVIQHQSDLKAVESNWTSCTVRPIHLRIHAVLTLVLLVVSIFAPSFRFVVKDPAIEKTTTDDYSLFDLAVPKDLSDMYDGAEVIGPIFMAFTYYVFVAVLPLGQNIALALLPEWRKLVEVVDHIGSASSLDVLVISSAIVIPYFGDILNQATDCWTPEGEPPAVQAEGQLLWGFAFMVACAISEFALIELVSVARDRPMVVQADSKEDKEEQQEVPPTTIGGSDSKKKGDTRLAV